MRSASPIQVTEELIEFVDGLLLGDACVSLLGRLDIGQSGDHRPWVQDIYDRFLRLKVQSTLTETLGGRAEIKGKVCVRKARTTLRTRTYVWFREQRQRWYPGGLKAVPSDVRLTPLSLAGWLCGDGCLGGKGYRVEFCTDGFPPNNVQWLSSELNRRFGWGTHVSKQNRIVLCRQADRDTLFLMVDSHVPECFRHKVQLKTRSSYFKLDSEKTRELMQLRTQGWSLKRLAAHFSMSKTGVGSAIQVASLATISIPVDSQARPH